MRERESVCFKEKERRRREREKERRKKEEEEEDEETLKKDARAVCGLHVSAKQGFDSLVSFERVGGCG